MKSKKKTIFIVIGAVLSVIGIISVITNNITSKIEEKTSIID